MAGLLLDLSRPPLPTCPSTQELCSERARGGAPEGSVVWSREQTAGKGRRDRHWDSPLDRGLWMSFLLRPRLSPAHWPALTPLVALAAAEALESLPQKPESVPAPSPFPGEADPAGPWRAAIKWPNDLFGRGGKLGGILAESSGDTVVIGLGLNLSQERSEFPEGVAAHATSLLLEGFRPVPTAGEMARRFNECLTAAYARFQDGAEDFLQAGLRRRFYLRRTLVEIRIGRDLVEGTAIDVGPGGELILRTATGLHTCISGEIQRVRPGGGPEASGEEPA